MEKGMASQYFFFLTFLISLLCCTVFGHTVDPKPYYDLDKAIYYFEEFLVNYNKTYASEEEKDKRFEIFKDVLIEVNKLNLESEDAIFGITKFADLTPEELTEFSTGFRIPARSLRGGNDCVQNSDQDVKTNTAPEERFDWRDLNVVAEAKNQATCGSCWAFAATGVVEAQYALKHKQLVHLSPQQLVDCAYMDPDYYSCAGGHSEDALSYLKKFGGQMSNVDYPYNATVNRCKFHSSKVIAKVTECYQFTLEDEAKLKEVLYTRGPLAIGIDFKMELYWRYHGGIINHTQCGTKTNHAVLLVGYGKTDNGKKYWIIRNSFGPKWGENGYFRLEMGTNACGMMTIPSIAASVA